MERIIVRNAVMEDLEQLVLFQKMMAQETESLELDESVLREGISALISDKNKGIYFVCEIEDELEQDKMLTGGCVMVTKEWSDWRNGWIWWIQSLFVLPQHRGKGLFSAMYEHLTTLISDDLQIKGIRLYVDKRNSHAQQVYEAMGMTGEHYTTYEWMK